MATEMKKEKYEGKQERTKERMKETRIKGMKKEQKK